MKRLLRAYLIGVLVTAGTVRQATGLHFYVAAASVALAFVFGLIALVGLASTRHGGYRDEIWSAAKIWFAGGFIITYGLLLTAIFGSSFTTAVQWVFYLGSFLLFPLFASAFQDRQGWIALIYLQIAVGFTVALADLLQWRSGGMDYQRLASAGFHNLLYFYALIAATLALLFRVARGRMGVAMGVAGLLLVGRMFLSLSRGEMAIYIGTILYGVIVGAWLNRRRVFRAFGISALLLIGFLTAVSMVPQVRRTGELYTAVLERRMSAIGSSTQYRRVEVLAAVKYARVVGAGLGATGDFGQTREYTTSSLGMVSKSYVHELPALLYWKLGIVGLLVYGWLTVMIGLLGRDALRQRDPLLAIWFGLMLAWYVNSLTTMVFTRIDTTAFWATWLGGYVWYRRERQGALRRNAWLYGPTWQDSR